jgi:predicted transcriptional regulator
MKRAPHEVPPPLELLCLKALWSLQEGNVKAVQGIVAETRPLAYTTIMTVLERLLRKGKLSRRKVGRSFVYLPLASRDEMRHAAVKELLDVFFGGSEDELLSFLGKAPTKVSAAAAGEGNAGIDTVLL